MFLIECLIAISIFLLLFTSASPQDKTGLPRDSQKRPFEGPKINGANFPDPCLIKVNDTWYAFATRTKGTRIHIQVATSNDFSTWNIVNSSDCTQYNALPTPPPWVYDPSPNTWAPDVNQLNDGTFIMYYSASTISDTSKHCIGAATSDTVLGLYVPQNESLICPLPQGGAIDASGYNDNGQRYLVWKVDGNSLGHGGSCGNTVAPIQDTPIILQRVAEDGYTLLGSPTTLLHMNETTDYGVIEAPALAKFNDTYVLFFSSGCFTDSTYTVNYATAPAIEGPYTRAVTPLFETGMYGLSGPGGADVDDDGHMLFHANFGSGRALYTAQVSFSNGQVVA